MMRPLIVCFLLAIASPAIAEPWSITWPAGWIDSTSEDMATPEAQTQRRKIEKLGGSLAAAVRHGEDGVMQVLLTTLPSQDHSRGALTSFEAGARDLIRQQQGTDVRYEQTEDATAITAEQVIRIHETQMFARRIIGFRDGAIVSVAATCVATAATCEQTLRSLILDRTGFAKLSELPSGSVDEGSSAYFAGNLIGIGLCAVVMALILWTVLKRRKR